MSVTAPEILEKQPAESILYAVDFTHLLRKDSGGNLAETLTGSPTVTSAPSGLTIASTAVTTAAWVKADGTEIKAAAGVQMRISSGTDGQQYRIEVQCGTSLSNTREADVLLQVKDT